MDIGFDFGANIPSGVFALHALVAVVFFGFAGLNATSGELIGVGLYLAIGAMVAAVGVLAARITARR
jgi:hypothetical protein